MKLFVFAACLAMGFAFPGFRAFNPAPPAPPAPKFSSFSFAPPAPPAPVFNKLPSFNPAPPAPPAPKFPIFNPAPPAPPAPIFSKPLPVFTPPQPLTQHCQYGPWTKWSDCSASACEENGSQFRTRGIEVEGSGYGTKCKTEDLEEWRDCQGPPCVLDCQMSQWSQWSQCSASCDEGRRARTRFALTQPKNGGAPCGQAEEWEACNERPCAQDCQMSQWSQWSQCQTGPQQCGEGRRDRRRFVQVPALNGGAPCGQTEEWEACQGRPCPQDCVMSDWSAWSRCSASCDNGQRSRTRSTLVQALHGGISCGPAQELEPCNEKPCAVDCVMSQWSQWSQCSEDCGKGRRSRVRFPQIQAQNGGKQCGPAEEWTVCNNGPCPQDCAYGAWTAWSACPACGTASRSRSRPITQQAAFGGAACDFGTLSESESCQISPCPVHCQMTQWSAWSACSADCDEGRRARTRNVLVNAAFGGRTCGPREEWEACNNGPCAQDCVMSDWSQWSQCSADCGEGRRARTRFTVSPALHGGIACGPAEEWEACNDRPCAQDCVMSDWSAWSQCQSGPQQCGEGRRARTRSTVTPALNGGLSCGPSEEWEACSNGPCSSPCQVSPWSSWSACSAECGSGQQSRTRTITAPAVGNGAQCPVLEDWRACESAPCRAPSVCDGVIAPQFFAQGCTAEFLLCANGQENHKICPGPSKFDIVSKTCQLPKDVLACTPIPANPPAPFQGYQ